MQRGMQATIEAKQDPGGGGCRCHDISQNRQIGHSNATGHHLVYSIVCRGGPPGKNTYILEGVAYVAEPQQRPLMLFAAIRQRCLQP
ncbi:hypothetical protein V8C34DRAFT_274421 [Trichoderma compactum]